MNSLVVLAVLGLVAAAQAGYLATAPVAYAAHPGFGAYHVPATYGAIGYHAAPAVHTVGYAHAGHGLVRIARSPKAEPEPQPDPQVFLAGTHVRTHHAPVVYAGAPAYGYGRPYAYAPVRTIYG